MKSQLVRQECVPVIEAPNPRSLKAAREQRKLDVFEVATYTKISPSRLDDFESGLRQPSAAQVDALAKLYNVPSYLLYLDATPNLELVLPDFRRSTPRPADLSPSGLNRIWSVERVSVFTKQLLGAVADKLPSFNTLSRKTHLDETYASRLRDEFDKWLLPKQDVFGFSGTPEVQYLGALRLFYETHKCLSLVNDAPPSDYFGFYSEPAAGVESVFVNRKISSKKAQLFTFVHELGHSILQKEGISDPFSTANSVERACNAFAAEFLAPKTQFTRLVEKTTARDRKDTASLIRRVSSQSLLSLQATAVRLMNLDYISQVQYRDWMAVWARNPAQEKVDEQEEQGSGGPGAYAKQLGELGCLPVYTAMVAVSNKVVDSLDVERGLGLSESVQDKAFALAKRRYEAAII